MLTDNLISYWKLDETSGNRVDSVVGSGNDLTQNNTVGNDTGKIGNCAKFASASSQYLSHVDNASLEPNVSFTIAGWFKIGQNSVSQTLMSKQSPSAPSDAGAWTLNYRQTNDRFSFITYKYHDTTMGVVYADNLGSPSLDTWYFIVCWFDSVNNNINIQVNNGTVNTTNTTGVPQPDSTPFTIGSNADPGAYLDGSADEIGFWKRVLTADEITQLYNAGAGLTYPFPSKGAFFKFF